MLTQVDSDGMSTTLMEAIVDHRRDDKNALQHHDKYVQTKNGRRHLRKTTKGWELLIKWKDKSKSWIKLADMKESHPVEVAEYARARGIDKEPVFEWWVPHTLKKRQVILSALKKRIRKTTHKYGIEIPTSVEHAFELDRKNGNNLWKDALEMEMYNIGVVENSNTRLLLISCSQGILSSSSFSCYLLLRLLVYMYLSQLMRTFTNYLKCIVISS